MVVLTFSNKLYEFSDNILKLSVYLNDLSQYRTDENEPLPLLKYDDEVFKMFEDWFKSLDFNFIDKITIIDNEVYNADYFKTVENSQLLKILNFACYNQITLLVNTVAYVLFNKGHFKKYDDKLFILLIIIS